MPQGPAQYAVFCLGGEGPGVGTEDEASGQVLTREVRVLGCRRPGSCWLTLLVPACAACAAQLLSRARCTCCSRKPLLAAWCSAAGAARASLCLSCGLQLLQEATPARCADWVTPARCADWVTPALCAGLMMVLTAAYATYVSRCVAGAACTRSAQRLHEAGHHPVHWGARVSFKRRAAPFRRRPLLGALGCPCVVQAACTVHQWPNPTHVQASSEQRPGRQRRRDGTGGCCALLGLLGPLRRRQGCSSCASLAAAGRPLRRAGCAGDCGGAAGGQDQPAVAAVGGPGQPTGLV